VYAPRNPYFSEFSYGFAVTENLVSNPGSNITVALVFPSLIEENQVGFDVMLQRPGKTAVLAVQARSSDDGTSTPPLRPVFRTQNRGKEYQIRG
jgi:hypothetical protein